MKIEYLADHPAFVPTIAAWQQAQFGYLTPTATLEDRTDRLRRSLQKDALPMALIALSGTGTLLGSAGILPTTITHQQLTPWLSSVYIPDEHLGRGIASALSLRAIMEVAKLGFEGCIYSRLTVNHFTHGSAGRPSSGSNTTAHPSLSWKDQYRAPRRLSRLASLPSSQMPAFATTRDTPCARRDCP